MRTNDRSLTVVSDHPDVSDLHFKDFKTVVARPFLHDSPEPGGVSMLSFSLEYLLGRLHHLARSMQV